MRNGVFGEREVGEKSNIIGMRLWVYSCRVGGFEWPVLGF
jgi:hypothetical protein